MELEDSVIGVGYSDKRFPEIVDKNKDLLYRLMGINDRGLAILDVGAGNGRFLRYFLGPYYEFMGNRYYFGAPIDLYVGIEPYAKAYVKLLSYAIIGLKFHYDRYGYKPYVQIIPDTWEKVREAILFGFSGSNAKMDVLILWNVVMFMDLRNIYNTDYLDAILKEIEVWSNISRVVLFSLYDSKMGFIHRDSFDVIMSEWKKHKVEYARKGYQAIFVDEDLAEGGGSARV